MIKKAGFIVILITMVLLSACSDKEMTPEDEIRLYIKTGVDAAESRSANDLGELVHDLYLGQKGLGKPELIKLLRLYFFRHKNIFLVTKIREISFPSTTEASVTLHVAMAGSVIADASMLSSLRARIYKFELQLIKQDKWLLEHATWQPASTGDME